MAILGVLSVEPSSGYDIRQSIATTLGHFWHESFGQIYPTLAKLDAEGLVRRVDADGRRTVYEITPNGNAQLERMLLEPIEPITPRNGTLLRLFFGRILGPERCVEIVERARASAIAQLAEFEMLERQLESDYSDHTDLPYWLITLRSGQIAAEATIRWATEASAGLAALDDRSDE